MTCIVKVISLSRLDMRLKYNRQHETYGKNGRFTRLWMRRMDRSINYSDIYDDGWRERKIARLLCAFPHSRGLGEEGEEKEQESCEKSAPELFMMEITRAHSRLKNCAHVASGSISQRYVESRCVNRWETYRAPIIPRRIYPVTDTIPVFHVYVIFFVSLLEKFSMEKHERGRKREERKDLEMDGRNSVYSLLNYLFIRERAA